jgi:hypothetical protein
MIEVVQYLAIQNFFEQFKVDDKAGGLIDLAGDGDLEGVVVPVPVAVGALSEDPQILLRSPLRVVIVVRGGELSLAGKVDHGRRSLALGYRIYGYLVLDAARELAAPSVE